MTAKHKSVQFLDQVDEISTNQSESIPLMDVLGRETQNYSSPMSPSHLVPQDCTIRAALHQLTQAINASQLTDKFILMQLKGIVELFSPMIFHNTIPTVELFPSVISTKKTVDKTTKLKLARKTQISLPRLDLNEPHVGVILYIGSPVDGHMIVYNENTVNQWLTYTQQAAENKIIRTTDNLLSINELASLVNISCIPGRRHAFEIRYGSISACDADVDHVKFKWESQNYPCTITTCRIP